LIDEIRPNQAIRQEILGFRILLSELGAHAEQAVTAAERLSQ